MKVALGPQPRANIKDNQLFPKAILANYDVFDGPFTTSHQGEVSLWP